MKKLTGIVVFLGCISNAWAIYNYQPIDKHYPQQNLSPACALYPQLKAGQSYSKITESLNPKLGDKIETGSLYMWDTHSGYQFSLPFLANGQPMKMPAENPARYVYKPGLKVDQPYYGYGVITPNQRKWLYLVSRYRANLMMSQQLLGSEGQLIGHIYRYQWADYPETLTLTTNLKDKLTDFSVNAFCGDIRPLIPISAPQSIELNTPLS